MINTYAVIQGDKIIRVYETSDGEEGAATAMVNEGLDGDLVLVPTPFEGLPGQAKAEFDMTWMLRPLRDRVADGFVTLPSDITIDDETGEPRKKTFKEQIDDGTVKLEPWQKYDAEADELVFMPWTERITAGRATREEWLDAVVRPYRNQLLYDADVIYCNPERWWGYSDAEKAAWSAYKQALRDFPAGTIKIVDDPQSLDWPTHPGEH